MHQQKTIHHSCFADETECLNCGYHDKGLYCSNCGSTFSKERISLSALSLKLVSVLANIEGRYFTTFKELFFRPVLFINKYLNGERERYYVPFKFLLINLTINFFLYNYFNIGHIDGITSASAMESEPLLKSEILFDQVISQYGKFFFLLIIPIYSVFTRVIHPKTIYNIAEIATAVSFLLGQLMLLEIVLNLFSAVYNPFYFVHKYLVLVAEISIVFLLCFRFFGNKLIHACWKTGITLIFLFFSMKYILVFTQWIIGLMCGD
jgi:hypothetical protein